MQAGGFGLMLHITKQSLNVLGFPYTSTEYLIVPDGIVEKFIPGPALVLEFKLEFGLYGV